MKVAAAMIAVWTSSLALATGAETRPAGDVCALVVNGISKDPDDHAAREGVVNGFRVYLREAAAVTPERLIVLTPEGKSPTRSTAEGIKNAIDALTRDVKPEDRFVFYYAGLTNAVGDSLRFNLPGPDITQDDLAAWLAGVKASTQLIVLDCPCAGKAVKALARPGRAIVLATTDQEAYVPQFGSYFIPALVKPESDSNHDGRVSVLEAFTLAAREIEQSYRQMQILPTETPAIEDDSDGRPSERPWRFEQDRGDGRLASAIVLAAGL
jgi:hypothetical protein